MYFTLTSIKSFGPLSNIVKLIFVGSFGRVHLAQKDPKGRVRIGGFIEKYIWLFWLLIWNDLGLTYIGQVFCHIFSRRRNFFRPLHCILSMSLNSFRFDCPKKLCPQPATCQYHRIPNSNCCSFQLNYTLTQRLLKIHSKVGGRRHFQFQYYRMRNVQY